MVTSGGQGGGYRTYLGILTRQVSDMGFFLGGGPAFRVWITSVIGQRIMVYRLFTQRVITGFSKGGKRAEV